jgi:hypothetical protein
MLALGEGLTPLVPSAIFWKTSSRDATLREKICFFQILFPGKNFNFFNPPP